MLPVRSLISVLCLAVATMTSAGVWAAEDRATLTYEQDIRPIFRAHCFDCHGATESMEGELDLRLVRTMQLGGTSGPAIVPGDPAASYLIERLQSGEMPPGSAKVPAEEIEIISRWIASGAQTARPEPDDLAPGLGITPEERSFWSFQPIQRPSVPDLTSFAEARRVRSEIDALIVAEWPDSVSFAPDADRATLIRRSFLILTGLPPDPAELESWLKDSGGDWYKRLVDTLLDSPHYGERWGRHWLDVAGYADSEGFTTSDAERSWAWKYRDWVIRALNDDLPFNDFITHQLAGDELSGSRDGDLTDTQIALLTATGFLRMAADGTGSGANTAEARNQVMADTLKIVGTSLLGLSLQCAQCHDHRYDPIPQTDYYALRAVFEPALDWQAWRTPAQRQISLYTEADRAAAASLESQTKGIAEEKAARLSEYLSQALDQELQKFDEPLRAELRVACTTSDKDRTERQKQLMASYPSVNITPGNLYQYLPDSRPELKKYDDRIAEVRAKKPVEEFIRALSESIDHAPETKLFFRGDHQQPKQGIAPAALTVTAPEGHRRTFESARPGMTTGRRLAFAQWLTSGQHPLVARVIVNRVWMHHFGEGLVATPAEFGKLGAAPQNLPLLDWLADEFMRNGWSLKSLHRTIMSSTVWKQAAEAGTETSSESSHVKFSRRSLIRLDAEVLRDRMLAASGQLDTTMFGPPVNITEDDTGQVIVDGGQQRRSVYVKVRRSQPVAMMQAFDAPVMQTNCESRRSSTVATQSLMLMNGRFTLAQAEHLADRAASEAVPDPSLAELMLPQIPSATPSEWSFGYGRANADGTQTESFTQFPHWTGTQWQGSPRFPDDDLGYLFLSAAAGHPQPDGLAVIRRWTAPCDVTVTISGTANHPSPHGNGVRCRAINSRDGRLGEWIVSHGTVKTEIDSFSVSQGDSIDFITDSNGPHTSDSFTWSVSLTTNSDEQGRRVVESDKQFHGPLPDNSLLPAQIVRAWQLALCRLPEDAELRLAVQFAADQVNTLQESGRTLPDGRSPGHQALVSVCQALLSSNEFLYVE